MQVYYYTYFTIYALETVFGYLIKDENKRKTWFCIISGAILICLIGLRHPSMGWDLGYYLRNTGYLYSFDQLNTYSLGEILQMKEFLNYERGYIIFNKLVGMISNNQQFFLFVCAVFSFVPIFFYIKRKSTLPLLSVFILMGLPVFFMLYSGLRQIIAIAITVCSVKYIEEKRITPFILTVLLASLFHNTAIVFLVAYPLYYVRMNDMWKLITVLALPVVFLFKKPLFSILSKVFKDNAVVDDNGAITLFLIFCAVYIYLILLNKKFDESQNGVVNLFYIACVCQAFGGIYQTAMRVGYYFMIYLIVALPNTITQNKNKQEYQTNYLIILIAFLVFGLYSIRTSTWAMAYPYYFFWEW